MPRRQSGDDLLHEQPAPGCVNLFGGVREKDGAKLKKSGVYALVILCFALGAGGGRTDG